MFSSNNNNNEELQQSIVCILVCVKTKWFIFCLNFFTKVLVDGKEMVFFSQNSPGNVKDVPKTISEAVHPRSSLITFLIDNKANG